MKTKSCFILGFPFAGKTTFLAALWYSLQQQGIHTKLSLDSFTGDDSYLSSLVSKWLSGEEMMRTIPAMQKDSLSVKLKDEYTNIFNLEFPDFSGEIFNNLYIDREIKPELSDKINRSDTFLLFINPEKIVESASISSIPHNLRYEGVDDTQTTIESDIVENDAPATKLIENKKVKDTIKRDPIENDSSAAKLIELLQFVDFLHEKQRIPLSIIVSAWDLVDKFYQLPEKCIKERLPMLWQYLNANCDTFDVKYYGISAQGGKLSNDDSDKTNFEKQIEDFLEQFETNPAERIQVLDGLGNKCHDITLPLWDLIRNI